MFIPKSKPLVVHMNGISSLNSLNLNYIFQLEISKRLQDQQKINDVKKLLVLL